jgi:uncharacterized protein
MGLFIIGGIFSLIGMILSGRLKSKFEQYSQVGLSNHLSGREIAEQMLRHYGIYDVKVQLAEGFLSDHYNPGDKTVNLSEMVYNGRSVSSAAVSAHECGHAVQHATGYSMLQMRSAIVPAVKFSTNIQQFLMPIALMTASSLMGKWILLITILVYGVTTAFSLIIRKYSTTRASGSKRRSLVGCHDLRLCRNGSIGFIALFDSAISEKRLIISSLFKKQ